MFDYPIHLPRDTDYHLFGLGPEATADEIREAATEVVAQLQAQADAAERRIAEIQAQVAGLREATDELKALRDRAEEVDPTEYARAQRTLRELEDQAAAIEPQYRELCARPAELKERIEKINCLPLHNPSGRAEYDQAHPPLELLKLADCGQDELFDNRLVLGLVRQELSQFFSAQGEEVFHPSDLTREDFSSDFHPNPILDGPAHE